MNERLQKNVEHKRKNRKAFNQIKASLLLRKSQIQRGFKLSIGLAKICFVTTENFLLLYGHTHLSLKIPNVENIQISNAAGKTNYAPSLKLSRSPAYVYDFSKVFHQVTDIL